MIEIFFATFRSLDDKSLTDESEQMIAATFQVIIDGKSEYIKSVTTQFLWSLRQELHDLSLDFVYNKEIREETKTPSRFIVEHIWYNLFYNIDKEKEAEENESL